MMTLPGAVAVSRADINSRRRRKSVRDSQFRELTVCDVERRRCTTTLPPEFPLTTRPIVLIAFAALLAAGCISSEELPKRLAVETAPLFFSASDFAEVQTAVVNICPSGFESTLTFAAEGDILGLAVNVAEAGSTTFETAGNPGLDTLIFLYGPMDADGFYGQVPIAVDDDSGEGLQAIVRRDLAAGEWFVVVTTSGGMGQGSVTLTGTSSCGEPLACVTDADCPNANSGDPATFGANAECEAVCWDSVCVTQCTYPDGDGDGIADEVDNCPNVANTSQADADGDGVGDACDDSFDGGVACEEDQDCYYTDGDAVCSGRCQDGQCVTFGCNVETTTTADDDDEDRVSDNLDNCIGIANPDQADSDGDGLGDACEESSEMRCAVDDDCDDLVESDDGIVCFGICENTYCVYPLMDPWNGLCTADVDNDRIPDDQDNCVWAWNPFQEDSDQDGIGDACDTP
ncbi:MAG: hypothetical protein ACI9MR_002584 [Myxococcota bacterium]|jgi:hypothetical protein